MQAPVPVPVPVQVPGQERLRVLVRARVLVQERARVMVLGWAQVLDRAPGPEARPALLVPRERGPFAQVEDSQPLITFSRDSNPPRSGYASR